MAQNMVLKIAGLFSYPNDLSEVPQGALRKADNIIVDRDSIAEPRRGFGALTERLPSTTDRAERFFDFKDKILARYNSSSLAWYQSSAVTFVGDVSSGNNVISGITSVAGLAVGLTVTGTGIPDDSHITAVSSAAIALNNNATADGANTSLSAKGWNVYTAWSYKNPATSLFKSRAAKANSNLYITTDNGVKKLDSATSGSPVDAGVPQALEVELQLGTSVSGFLSSNGVTAYRVLWGYKDANDNLLLGAASDRALITNTTTSSVDVNFRLVIPDGIDTNYFYQVYRSAPINASTAEEPNDELQLVYEANPTADEISNGITLYVTDLVPESLRNLGATWYASPSQEGVLQSNEQPPFAMDIAPFKNCVFYANTRSKHNLNFNIVGVGGTTGIQFRAFFGDMTSGSSVISNISDITALEVGMRLESSLLTASATIVEVSTTSKIVISGATATSTATGVEFKASDVLTIAGTEYVTRFGSQEYASVTKITTSGLISGLSTTAGLSVGMSVRGEFIPVGATISTITSSTTITISATPTSPSSGGSIIVSSAAIISSGAFTVNLAGTPAQNIADTSKSLRTVVNRFSSNTSVYAFYISNFDDLPGQMQFKERSIGGGSFFATVSSHVAAYDPTLPTSGSSVASTNDAFANGLYFSKVQQPEAVPTLNNFRIGSADENILRIIASRDSLFIFKEDGVFRLTGEDPTSFRVDPFDLTTRLIGPETAVPLSNLIYFLSDQGVARLSESNVEVVSRPIEEDLLMLFPFADLENSAFAISYESERRYQIFLPTSAADTSATQQYVFNTFTNAWTRWTLNKQSGFVNPADDKMYLGDATTSKVNQERKSRTFRDYADDEEDAVITAVSSGMTLTLSNFSALTVEVGYVIKQSSSVFGVIDTINSSTGTVTVHQPGASWSPKIDISITADLNTSSATISNVSDTTNLVIGQNVSGVGVPANTQILRVDTSTSATLTNTPTTAGTGVTLNISSSGEAQLLTPINVELEFTAQFLNNPGITKQFRDMTALFKELNFFDVEFGFSSDLSRSVEKVALTQTGTGSWGLFPWGEQPWGGTNKTGVSMRTYVPAAKQRCSKLFVKMLQSEAYALFQLAGFSIMSTQTSERTTR